MDTIKRTFFGALLIALIFLAGCYNFDSEQASDKLQVVATTTMLTDLLKEIGGEHVEVNGLMSAGVDPHLYKASARDVIFMQSADLVAYSGLELEGKMGEIFQGLEKQKKTVIALENGLSEKDVIFTGGNSKTIDPHIWFDVELWQKAAVEVSKGLISADPENEISYQANVEAYLLELEELDLYVTNRVNELPEENRILVTAHDAFSYFGKGYGFNVIGLQGLNTKAEAGTGDISQLADFIVENDIKAIFIESSVPTRTIESLQAATKAKGFDVEIGGELYSDSLGDQENDTETYIKTVKSNVDTIVDALK
ncbi:metal ABC transporter solute-binding protein, Zn/Mn family [Carnobacterium pleistocenium]|uniref:metal ABC transporter solute-binding protein, Zn/Mn family n=1 Tax=Carnobacterium pleistocenium TaxID=181073 RepID=UPI000554F78E|nr:zinc ABC transporter substrate-binding protein [Carnobacterium pleistocenium]